LHNRDHKVGVERSEPQPFRESDQVAASIRRQDRCPSPVQLAGNVGRKNRSLIIA
jgi:hypothetical protein